MHTPGIYGIIWSTRQKKEKQQRQGKDMNSRTCTVTGIVLSAVPVGEYDKSVALLTKERGKIRAFARGARRPGNPLMAASNLFAFGEFQIYEGRTSYSISQVAIRNYFSELMRDFEGACYGQYFLEFADYYIRENVDGMDFLRLVYQSLRALSAPALPRILVRRIFELKALMLTGECPQTFEQFESWNLEPSTLYALQYVTASSIEKLYTFRLADEVFEQFSGVVSWLQKHYTEHQFKSLEILETC